MVEFQNALRHLFELAKSILWIFIDNVSYICLKSVLDVEYTLINTVLSLFHRFSGRKWSLRKSQF